MTFDEFERRAWEEWERIPDDYRHGVDGLLIERAAKPHPTLPDVYTLGECLTESYPSQFHGPDTTRSLVVLHYGSFFRLSRLDPGFDWEAELWETLTHELQHHLESLADDDALGDMDYAADENFKRYQGEAFDPFFYRAGLEEDGWRRVEEEYFLETAPAPAVEFEWASCRYVVDVPATEADVAYVAVDGVEQAPGALYIVLVREPRGVLESLRALLRPRAPAVAELEATARPVGSQEGEA